MKLFLNTCGIADSLRLVVESPRLNEPERRLLPQPFAVIGRDPQADVCLDHAEVSRRHVYLQMIEGRAFWIDLESRTGSRDEKKPQKFGWLEGVHTLCVGPYVIRRLADDGQIDHDSEDDELPQDTPLIAQAYSRGPLPEVTLEFLNGPSQATSWPVHRLMSLIGSASGCKFRLTDPSVSRFHGSLVRTPAGVWIVDLLGKGGITVDDVPIRAHRLMDGDVLGIGRYQLRIRCRHQDQGSGKGLSKRGRSTLAPKPSRQNYASNILKFPDWAAPSLAIETEHRGATEAQLPQPVQQVSSFPNVDIMLSESSFSGQLAQSGLTELVLVPLVNQFGLMQQQMFDQFQQAMAMMIQMFGTMHRDQMDVIRAELDRLHELTDEFHALKDELSNRTREQAQPVSSEPAGHDRVAGTVAGALAQRPAARSHKPANDLAAAQVEPAPAVPSLPPASGIAGHQPVREPRRFPTPTTSSSSPPGASHSSAPSPVEPAAAVPPWPAASSVAGHQPVRESRPLPTPTTPASSPVGAPRSTERPQDPGLRSQPKSDVARPAGGSERDTIVWLHQRIQTLQNERESRWQKILKLLPGVS
jgi:pSer/pThr/pTyr-binding forkhead associated (FHA) protein